MKTNCEFCNKAKHLMQHKTKDKSIDIGTNSMYSWTGIQLNITQTKEFYITAVGDDIDYLRNVNYCPICGKELNKKD